MENVATPTLREGGQPQELSGLILTTIPSGDDPPPVPPAPGALHTVNPPNTTSSTNETDALISQLHSISQATSFGNIMLETPAGPDGLSTVTPSQIKLRDMFDNVNYETENMTDDNWKYPDYPLARIKKIMRIDEDVKMISGEVPILFSKAVEMFVTELTLRAWIYTEETRRRTLQRSDIAMAIAKNDMFDFLIDIVPREEIQTRGSKSSKESTTAAVSGDGIGNQPTDLLQAYLQLLSQPTDATGLPDEAMMGEESSDQNDVSMANFANLTTTSNLIQQQMQLLQQLAQLQQPQVPSISTSEVSSTHQYDTPTTASKDTNDILGLAANTNNDVQIEFGPDQTNDIVSLLSTNHIPQLVSAVTSHNVIPPPPPLLVVPPTSTLNSDFDGNDGVGGVVSPSLDQQFHRRGSDDHYHFNV